MPPLFIELDPEEVRKALEGQEDVLSGARDEQNAFYASKTCPRGCGAEMVREHISQKHTYVQGELLPRWGLRCVACHTLIDPYTDIIVSRDKAR